MIINDIDSVSSWKKIDNTNALLARDITSHNIPGLSPSDIARLTAPRSSHRKVVGTTIAPPISVID